MPFAVLARTRRQNRSQPAAFAGSPATHAGPIRQLLLTRDAIADPDRCREA